MARAGEGDLEMHYTATFRTHPPPQAAGTLYYPMDVDDMPAASGSRPDRLTEVRPQERVQRHTVEQIILAPVLDVPVPLMEAQLLVDAFAPHDIHVPEQVVEVPKVFIDELSVRTPVREPQLAEQLVEAPIDHLLFLVAADCGAERGHSSSVWWCARFSGFSPRTEFNIVASFSGTHF